MALHIGNPLTKVLLPEALPARRRLPQTLSTSLPVPRSSMSGHKENGPRQGLQRARAKN